MFCCQNMRRVSKIGVANPAPSPEALVDAALDTLLTALYVKTGDMLVKDRRPGHPASLSQSELVCLAVAQALLGFHSEHRWIRFATCHLRAMFPYLPHQPGYSKRLRAALLIESVNDTLKGQLDLEAHGGRTFDGVAIRVAQRILAMAAAIWHNNKTGQPVTRSLTAYDH